MRLFSTNNLRIILIIGITISLGVNLSPVNANSTNPPLVTTIDRTGELSSFATMEGTGVSKTQSINLNTSAVEILAQNLFMDNKSSQNARFQIFNDLSLDVNFTKVDHTLQTGYIMAGKINNDPESSILLTSTDGIISAKFDYQGKQILLTSDEMGNYRFEEIDQSLFPSEIDILPENPQSITDFSSPSIDSTTSTGGYIIDVLVVYTDDARAAAGGTVNMQNLINLAVSETNLGYERSGITSQMRLVHAEEINYDESILTTSTGWGTALSQLTNQDNILDEVRTMRNTYGADLVVMMVNNMTYCGIGWLMTPSYTFDSVGNSLVSRACATGYYSLAHETGHNMGAHHDRANSGGGSAMYSYSFGYQDPGSAFRTIMAYNCPSGCPRINNWSNPEVYYNGKPTGVASTATNSADNRLTLNQTAPIVANFRDSKIAPYAPTNLAIQDVKSTTISVSFLDNSSDEQGFKVERSTDNTKWIAFSTLPQNTTSFEDKTLACGEQFFYRVYAYNPNGNSAYSNVATTGLMNCNPPAPLTDIKVLSSISSITLDWQSDNTSTSYLVQIEDELTHTMAMDPGLEVSQLPIVLSGLAKGTTYIITIIATNEFGTTVNEPITIKTMTEVVYLPLTAKR